MVSTGDSVSDWPWWGIPCFHRLLSCNLVGQILSRCTLPSADLSPVSCLLSWSHLTQMCGLDFDASTRAWSSSMDQRFDPSRPPPCTRCRDERNRSIHHDQIFRTIIPVCVAAKNIYKPTLRILGVDVSSPSTCGPRKWPAWSGLP